MKDDRRAPFAYQELAATAAIRGRFEGQKRLTAIAVYQTMTEVANEHRTREHFEAERRELAERAGCSPDTIDRYADEFVALGLLSIERRTSGRLNLPNLWTLLTPRGGRTRAATGGTGAPGGRGVKATPGRGGAATGGRTGAAPVNQEEQVKEPPNPPEGGRSRDRSLFKEQLRSWTDAQTDLLALAPSPDALFDAVERAMLGSAKVRGADGVREHVQTYYAPDWARS